MVRDLDTGAERAVFDGLSRDGQETWSVFGVYPNFAWTPDGNHLVIWAKGKIVRVDLATTSAADFPGFLGRNRAASVSVSVKPNWEAQTPELVWRQEIGAGAMLSRAPEAAMTNFE